MPSPGAVAKFVDLPKTWVGQVVTANALRDGTGTVATIMTAGVLGSHVEMIRGQAIVTTTAGAWRIFLHDGTNFRLYVEIDVDAVTVGASVAGFSAEFRPTVPLILPTGWSLRASTENAETANIFVQGGDF